MEPVRIAVVGTGTMGSAHARDCAASESTELVAVADSDTERAGVIAEKYGCAAHGSAEELFARDDVEAVIVTTPHYSHPTLAVAAFDRNLHVLVEKPVGVHVNAVRTMLDAHAARSQLVFAAMFQQRTYGHWMKIKSILEAGELGRLVRTTWIITTWFRTQAYYDSGGWRATWRGEGGGVLLNQCPHNLDLYQWFVGMPRRLYAQVSLGKYHRIEVEDEVTMVMEHPGGMVGHFITNTAESPGTNRLEIVGEHGVLVYDGSTLVVHRNDRSMLELLETSTKMFESTHAEREEIAYQHHGQAGHRLVIENFAAAIRKEAELIAPAAEGLASVEMANAALLSHFSGAPVTLPIDGDAWESKLTELSASGSAT